MANYWATRGQDVTLITIGSEEKDWYVLSPKVTRVAMNLEVSSTTSLIEAIRHNAKRLRRLRGHIRASRPDVVISFMEMINVLTLLATLGLRIPVIISERRPGYACCWWCLERAQACNISAIGCRGNADKVSEHGHSFDERHRCARDPESCREAFDVVSADHGIAGANNRLQRWDA